MSALPAGGLILAPPIQDNSRRQKQLLNQRFEALCSVLEERKAELLQALAREQEEKLLRVRGLIRQYGDHLEASSKLVESAIQSMEEPQMALYLQVGPGGGRQAAERLRGAEVGGLAHGGLGSGLLSGPHLPHSPGQVPPPESVFSSTNRNMHPRLPRSTAGTRKGLCQHLARCLRSPSFLPCSRPRS